MATIKLLSGGGSGRGKGFAGSGGSGGFSIMSWKKANENTLRDWGKMAMSRDGRYQVAGVKNGFLYHSSDYGVTWVATTDNTAGDWREICCSYDGHYFYASRYGVATGIYFSNNYGQTFAPSAVLAYTDWTGVSCDASGQYALATRATVIGNWNYRTDDFGVAWDQSFASPGGHQFHGAVSGNNNLWYLAAWGTVYKSTDQGTTWGAGTLIHGANETERIKCDYTGNHCLAAPRGFSLLSTSDGGVNWYNQGWVSYIFSDLAMSSDGKYQVLQNQNGANAYGFLFLSEDYGVTWKAFTPTAGSIGVDIADNLKHITRTTTVSVNAEGYIWIKP